MHGFMILVPPGHLQGLRGFRVRDLEFKASRDYI